MDENNKQNKPTGEKRREKGVFTSSDNFETTNATGKTAQKEIKDNRLWGVVM